MPDTPDQSGTESTRRQLLTLLGGGSAATLAGCSAILGDGSDGTDDGGSDGTDDGGSDGTDDGGSDGTDDDGSDGTDEEVEPAHADKAQAAWERIEANPAPTDEAEQTRTEAYIEIEEAVRDDMIMLPLYHGLTERFWYDYVDVPPTGALGAHHQQHNETAVQNDTELNLRNRSFDTLDPAQSTDTASASVINQMYETLTHYPNGVAELENKLLSEFEVSEDGLTWTFTIADGVQFHDGRDLTAADVVYSWERLALSENSTRANFILGTAGFLGLVHETDEGDGLGPQSAVPDSLGLEAVDDRTLEMEIASPNPGVIDILTYTGFAVVPEGYVDDHPAYEGEVSYEEFDQATANGTGPFEFDAFTIGEEASVVRNDDYHGQTPDVESVHWEIIEDDEAAYTYAMEQNADIFGVPTQFYDRDLIDAETDDRGRDIGTYGPHENDETTAYLAVPELSTFYFGFNARTTERPIRRAIAYVTDHEELIENVFEGRGVEAFSFTPPGIWPTGSDGYETFVDAWPYSPNETDIPAAEELLSEAGYTPDDPFALTITTYQSEVFQEAAELTREKLAGTGVDIELEQAPFNTLLERGRDGDLQVFSLGWIWSWRDVAYGHFGFEPQNTNTDRMPGDATGYYLDWHVDLQDTG